MPPIHATHLDQDLKASQFDFLNKLLPDYYAAAGMIDGLQARAAPTTDTIMLARTALLVAPATLNAELVAELDTLDAALADGRILTVKGRR